MTSGCVVNPVFSLLSGQALPTGSRPGTAGGRWLWPGHQHVHLRGDPEGDEEGKGVSDHVRQGGRIQEPGTHKHQLIHTNPHSHDCTSPLMHTHKPNVLTHSLTHSYTPTQPPMSTHITTCAHTQLLWFPPTPVKH